MNCDYDDGYERAHIVIRSLRDDKRKIAAIKAIRALCSNAGFTIGLKEAKAAVDSLATGGSIKIYTTPSDAVLIKALCDASGLSEYAPMNVSVMVIG